jgi:hypothetical protein
LGLVLRWGNSVRYEGSGYSQEAKREQALGRRESVRVNFSKGSLLNKQRLAMSELDDELEESADEEGEEDVRYDMAAGNTAGVSLPVLGEDEEDGPT